MVLDSLSNIISISVLSHKLDVNTKFQENFACVICNTSLMRKGRIVIIKWGQSIIISINNSVKCLVKLIVITTPLRKGVECRI